MGPQVSQAPWEGSDHVVCSRRSPFSAAQRLCAIHAIRCAASIHNTIKYISRRIHNISKRSFPNIMEYASFRMCVPLLANGSV